MAPRRKTTTSGSDDQDVDDKDYKKKRERNNRAVKLCREKSTQNAQETKVRVEVLKTENLRLEERIDNTKKHVKSLKGMLLELDNSEEKREAIRKIIEDSDDD